MNRTYTVRTSLRDRIERHVRNSIIANAARVEHGLFDSARTNGDKADRIARLVTEDLLKDYRLERRR